MPLQAIGFDIDGTLYPASSLYSRMLPGALGHMRLLYTFSEVRKELRTLINDPAYRALGIHSVDALHHYQARMVADRLRVDVEKIRDTIETFFYRDSEEAFAGIPLFPGVTDLLDELRTRGFRLAALSDFPCGRKLELMGLKDRFDLSMTSEETGLVKPDPASFNLMAERLGVPNDKILYVGNSERYDIAGARAAGMFSALISRRKDVRSAADFVFGSYDELRRYILSQAGCCFTA